MQQSMQEALTPESYVLVTAALPPRLAAFAQGDPAAHIQTRQVDQTTKDGRSVTDRGCDHADCKRRRGSHAHSGRHA